MTVSSKKDVTMTEMAKRIFLQIEVPSEEYKAELQKRLPPATNMSNYVRQMLEEKHPTLRNLALYGNIYGSTHDINRHFQDLVKGQGATARITANPNALRDLLRDDKDK